MLSHALLHKITLYKFLNIFLLSIDINTAHEL